MPTTQPNQQEVNYFPGENTIRVGQKPVTVNPSAAPNVPMHGTNTMGVGSTGMGSTGMTSTGMGSSSVGGVPPSSMMSGTTMQPCGMSHGTTGCSILSSNTALVSSQDFRMLGREVEILGDYLALMAAESKGRMMTDMEHATTESELTKGMSKDKDQMGMGRSRMDTFVELERISKKIARQGRKLAYLKDISMFGHAVRYDQSEYESNMGLNQPLTSEMMKMSLQSKTLPGLSMLKPSFLGKPISTQQQLAAIGHEIEMIGNFLMVESARHNTQSELDKRRAIDVKDKDSASFSKHESKMSGLYEKYGRKIARHGQAIANLTLL